MKTDETRIINEETSLISEDTNCIDNTGMNTSDTTILEDESQEKAAPEAGKESKAGRNAAFAAAGVAVGVGTGLGVSAMAAGGSKSDGLSKAATPDDEKTADELAKSDIVDPSIAPEEEEVKMNITEEHSADSIASAGASAEREVLLNPDRHSEPVRDGRADVNLVDSTPSSAVEQEVPVAVEQDVTEPGLAQAPVNVNVTVNIDGQEVAVTPVQPVPEVSVESMGVIMDSEGNVITHAEVTVDDVKAVLIDHDNDGTVDVAVIDADNDGVITEDEIVDMSGTGLTMTDVASVMTEGGGQLPADDTLGDQLAMNDDFAPDMDIDL